MKNLFLYFILFSVVFSVYAESNLTELHSLTNLILKAYDRTITMDTYQNSLKTLKSFQKDNEGANKQVILNALILTNRYEDIVKLDETPPSKALPLYFSLFENDELTDWQCSLMDNQYKGSFGEWVYQLIIQKLQIFTQEDRESVMMLWLPEQSVMWNDHDLAFFWYYAGLKYLPTLWNDWHRIWKMENARKEPREEVLKKLAKEIARQFNYHLFPFVAKAIEEGDATLKPLLKELSNSSYHRFWLYHSFSPTESLLESSSRLPADYPQFNDEKTFLVWWDKYKDNYTIPPSGKKLSDIRNIFERKYPAWYFTKEMYKSALQAEKALDEYCKLKERPISNCWYFTMKEGDEKNWE